MITWPELTDPLANSLPVGHHAMVLTGECSGWLCKINAALV